MKRCPKCKETKPYSEFGPNKSRKDGLDCYCKKHRKEIDRIWATKNREKRRDSVRQWRKNNPEQARESASKWRANNPGKALESTKRWKSNNPKKAKEATQKWKIKNPEKVRIIEQRKYRKKQNTPNGSLINRMRSGIYHSLKNGSKNGRHWEDLVGYSLCQLKKHIEKQFKDGMSWDNYGKWHIDHCIPISVFNFEKPEDADFKKCWALENLRLMWARENIRKGKKIRKPFQPSLIF